MKKTLKKKTAGRRHKASVLTASLPAESIIPARFLMADKSSRRASKKAKSDRHAEFLHNFTRCDPGISAGPGFLSLYFPGVRLYSLNELFAIMQYRKFHVFDYKKYNHELLCRAVSQLRKASPGFTLRHPLKIYLYRSSSKKVDPDALSAMFKYLIDGLMKSGLINDDSSEYVSEYVLVQDRGEPAVGIRLEETPQRQMPDVLELFPVPATTKPPGQV